MAMTPLPLLDRTAATFRSDVDEFFSTDLPTFVTEANALQTDVAAAQTAAGVSASAASSSASAANGSAVAAASSASAALASETAAAASASSAVNAPGTSASSASSVTIGTGSKAFTIQTGKAFSVGQFVIVADASAPANYMVGQITAHNSGIGALNVNVTSISGSGTLSDWVISLSAAGGPPVTPPAAAIAAYHTLYPL